MNIGILVYSYTGNTLLVAERIKEQIEKEGNQADIHRITCVDGKPSGNKAMVLKDVPDVSKYDKLIIGAPINAFSLCNAMKLYFKESKISASQVNCFVTQQFKSAFFGGNRGIRQISKFVTEQGAKINNKAIVHWSSKERETQIINASEQMARF